VHATVPLPEGATVRHIIDARQSRFIVQAFATGLLSVFAHSPSLAIRDFEGEVDLGAAANPLSDARLDLRIRADSLEVTDDLSDKDRAEIQHKMREEVLETREFPEISYNCSRVTGSGVDDRYWVVLRGELTLHGVTRDVPVTAKVILNGTSLRASGEFSVRQSDFGIALVNAAAGTIRVKDEVKCRFDIVARRQA
jgi:polyisoprenoid-binding protein YceI